MLDFGASRDGVPESKRGKRIVVDTDGLETFDVHDARENTIDLDGTADE